MFVNALILCYAAAQFIWTLSLAKRAEVRKPEKAASIFSALVYLVGFLLSARMGSTVPAALFLLGFVVSEFTIGIAFYETIKNIEVSHE